MLLFRRTKGAYVVGMRYTTGIINIAESPTVIIVDDTKKRDMWKLGRVIKAYSSDNHVKKVEVRRGDGKIIHRDRSKIVLLKMNERFILRFIGLKSRVDQQNLTRKRYRTWTIKYRTKNKGTEWRVCPV